MHEPDLQWKNPNLKPSKFICQNHLIVPSLARTQQYPVSCVFASLCEILQSRTFPQKTSGLNRNFMKRKIDFRPGRQRHFQTPDWLDTKNAGMNIWPSSRGLFDFVLDIDQPKWHSHLVKKVYKVLHLALLLSSRFLRFQHPPTSKFNWLYILSQHVKVPIQ